MDMLIQGTSIDGQTNATTIDPATARRHFERGFLDAIGDLVPSILKSSCSSPFAQLSLLICRL